MSTPPQEIGGISTTMITTIISGGFLIASEILPFLKGVKSNGVVHWIWNMAKGWMKPKTPMGEQIVDTIDDMLSTSDAAVVPPVQQPVTIQPFPPPGAADLSRYPGTDNINIIIFHT